MKKIIIVFALSFFIVTTKFGVFQNSWFNSQTQEIQKKACQIKQISISDHVKELAQNINTLARSLYEYSVKSKHRQQIMEKIIRKKSYKICAKRRKKK
jgi:nitrogen fixation/metabolism regulation signal transduction histidine kinase